MSFKCLQKEKSRQEKKKGKINKFKIIGTKSSVRSISYLKAASLLACDMVPWGKTQTKSYKW